MFTQSHIKGGGERFTPCTASELSDFEVLNIRHNARE